MKKLLAILAMVVGLGVASNAILTFYLIDNFEDGTFNKWFSFDNVKLSIMKNPKSEKKDLVLESCGDNALKVAGTTKNWYVGGVGTNLNVDPENYSRLQLDVMGSAAQGKIKVELYEDSNKSGQIEQDPNQGWKVTSDKIWAVELPIMKDGYCRYSIPFSAFGDANPGIGSGKFGEGPILRMQLIFVAASQEGTVDCALDNIIITN
jgi:hypothetical protein